MGFIITFYSFKGGVGRTMSLANIATLLSRNGKKVLMVDWDLEAPGLDQYFEGFETQLSETKGGLLELLEDSLVHKQPNWRKYVAKIDIGGEYHLDLLRSGREDETYPQRVLDFDWTEFYQNHNGGAFIEKLRESWQKEYDMVLIDSRTGYTDAGGICTIQLPDVLILVFTANEQSLNGVKKIAQKAQKGRQKLAYDRMPLLVFPLLSRFDGRTEFNESQNWLKKISYQMADFYDDYLPVNENPIRVLELTKLPYIAHFSFGEKLAVVSHGFSDPESLGYIYNVVTKLIEGKFQNLQEILLPAAVEDIREETREALAEAREISARARKLTRRSFFGLIAGGAVLAAGAATSLVWLRSPPKVPRFRKAKTVEPIKTSLPRGFYTRTGTKALQYVNSEGIVTGITNTYSYSKKVYSLNNLKRVNDMVALMSLEDFVPRINLNIASLATEQEALIAIQQNLYEKACLLLIWGLRHDLVLVSRTPIGAQPQKRPNYRLCHLLAGVAVRYHLTSFLREAHSLVLAYTRYNFSRAHQNELLAIDKSWSDTNSSWYLRWNNNEKRLVWSGVELVPYKKSSN